MNIEELKQKYFKHICAACALAPLLLWLLISQFLSSPEGGEAQIWSEDDSARSEAEQKLLPGITATPQPELIEVELTGFVENPGVYQVPKGTILLELIELANANQAANTSYIHKELPLSKQLIHGDKFYIPSATEQGATAAGGNNSGASNKISLNQASLAELMELPGVGESTAQKIIDARPYTKLGDLLNVSGIGEATYNKIVSKVVL